MAASRIYSLSARNGKPVVDRISFAKIHEPLRPPNLLGLQTDSFGWLVGSEQRTSRNPGSQSGPGEIFEEISPIENAAQTMGLVLLPPHLEDPKYSIAECREHDLTYAAPLYVTAEFQNYETGEIKSQTAFIGDFPLMTERGTLIINGTERVVISQLVCSPDVYYERLADKTSGKGVFNVKIIPSRGAWLEFEIDKRDVAGVRVNCERKQSAMVFLKVLDMSESEIREIFGDFPALIETLEKDTVYIQEEASTDLYRKLRPGKSPTTEAGHALLNNFYFNAKRYDTARVGCFKLSKKLGFNPANESRQLGISDITAVLHYLLTLHAGHEKVVCGEGDAEVEIETDNIDHFGNRRVRAVDKLIQNQARTGLSHLDRMVHERITTQETEVITPSPFINIRPIVAAIKEFFGTPQPSQFMDQNNPLAGLTHKRRLSALGPDGLFRDRAGMEVRDVHSSHYSRICPIETPEGLNIGLIGSLTSFARINPFGFIETSYRVVNNGAVTNKIVYPQADDEDRAVIVQAEVPLDENNRFVDEEALCRMPGGEPALIPADEIDFMDVSARQMCSMGTAMILFLEHDDANRALMDANMQHQAVPLIRPSAPYVGTGMEMRSAVDAGDVTVAKEPGVVLGIDADSVVVEQNNGRHMTYKLTKFDRSNPGNCTNQQVVVGPGDRLEVGTLIAGGPATEGGEFALGQNLLVALITWNGFNYEDTIILSERCAKDDLLTSIHVEEHEVDAHDTKLGPEEIARDIPNVLDEMLSHLDEHGVVRISAEVQAGDILVEKITPKGETELTSEERLFRAIFGEKAKEAHDTSLRVPHGESEVIIGVRQFTKNNNDELASDVNETVRAYAAQRRKITIGDKMAGRHRNKGVISRILPVGDTSFMEDGTSVDIILNPLGVPDHMNLGQVYELHLERVASQGWDASAARETGEVWAERLPEATVKGKPGQHVAAPVFGGVRGDELAGLPGSTLPNRDDEALANAEDKAGLLDGRSGEPFPGPTSVGYMYMLEPHYLVDDKIYARSTSPHSMATQQPLGGKAQFGEQCFGEMEVWALEAYGASHALQEMLTIKSDDTVDRVKVYGAIVKGDNVPEADIPESFKVLIQEMRSLCLNVEALDAAGQAISLQGTEEDQFQPLEPAAMPTGLEDLTSGADF